MYYRYYHLAWGVLFTWFFGSGALGSTEVVKGKMRKDGNVIGLLEKASSLKDGYRITTIKVFHPTGRHTSTRTLVSKSGHLYRASFENKEFAYRTTIEQNKGKYIISKNGKKVEIEYDSTNTFIDLIQCC